MKLPLWIRVLRPGKLPFYWSLYGLGVLSARWLGAAENKAAVLGVLLSATLLYEAQVFLNDYVDREVDQNLDKPTWIRAGVPPPMLLPMALGGTLLACFLAWFWAGWAGVEALAALLLLGAAYHLPVYPLKRVWPFSIALIACLGLGAFALGIIAATGSPEMLQQIPPRWWIMLFLSFFLVLGNKDRPDASSETRYRQASLFTLFPGSTGLRFNAFLTFLGFLMPPLWLWPVPWIYLIWALILGTAAVMLSLHEPYREDLFWMVYFLYAVPTLWIFRAFLLRG